MVLKRRGPCGVGLKGVRDEIRLLLSGLAAVFRALIEIQLTDDLESEQIALQDADFGIEIAWVVIIHDRHGIFKRDQVRVGLVHRDPAHRLIDRCLAQAGDRYRCEDAKQAGEYDPFALDEDPQVFAQYRFMRR